MFAAEPVRRAFRRYVRLDCQVVREHDLSEVADLALDLSTKGMLVRARKRVLTGEEVIVTFRPPRSNTYVDAPATVARVLHGRRPGDHGSVCLGLEFYGMRADEEQFLFEQLRGMSAPDAMRPPRTLAQRHVRAA
jgi:PilZ domain